MKKTIQKASPSAKKEIAKAQSKAKDLTGAQVEVIEKETKLKLLIKLSKGGMALSTPFSEIYAIFLNDITDQRLVDLLTPEELGDVLEVI